MALLHEVISCIAALRIKVYDWDKYQREIYSCLTLDEVTFMKNKAIGAKCNKLLSVHLLPNSQIAIC